MVLGDVLVSPPVAGCVFLLLAFALYRLGGRLAAPGEDHPGKHRPYACGEDLLPPESHLTYHAFFQLALMFGLLHLATIVISTVPFDAGVRPLAVVYLVAIVVSVLVLSRWEEEEE
jgi:NADH:ubiquinone oxidoreductase subunit 3 (subunit A)